MSEHELQVDSAVETTAESTAPATWSRLHGVSGAARTIARHLGEFLLSAVIVLWGAATLAFTVLKLIPGDPVSVILGPLSSATPEARAAIRHNLGLDRSVVEQYLTYMSKVARGDLGRSYQLGRDVTDILAESIGPTFALAASAIVLALVFAVAGSLISRSGVGRMIVSCLELLAVSAPVFWTALILAAVFSYHLGWVPVIGGSELTRLILPSVTMSIPLAGTLGQVLRNGLDAADAQPFALTARARGLSRRQVTLRHSLRHAGAGTLTLTGYLFGSVLGGAVLIETVFARPGLGRTTLDAILGRDIPTVMGVVLLSGVLFVVINALVDIAAVVIDPRLRGPRLRRRAEAS